MIDPAHAGIRKNELVSDLGDRQFHNPEYPATIRQTQATREWRAGAFQGGIPSLEPVMTAVRRGFSLWCPAKKATATHRFRLPWPLPPSRSTLVVQQTSSPLPTSA